MTSINRLKLIKNAGEPDDALALRIDVVRLAVEWSIMLDNVRTDGTGNDAAEEAEDALEIAVRKYRRALRRRMKL